MRLHVEQPLLGLRQIRLLLRRIAALDLAPETIRRILIRRRALAVELEQAKRRRRRYIRVQGARELWGLDLTLVWILGIFPAWIVGIVDYHGSRLVAFKRIACPTGTQISNVLDDAIAVEGAPKRILTDCAPVFLGLDFQLVLAAHGVDHNRIKPGHAWTNGRIERVFRTFKETIFGLVWVVASRRQLDRFSDDFIRWHNQERPHSAWGGRTPDEVHFGRPPGRAIGRVHRFDGRMIAYRFS